jgi:hypothetical protein
MKRLLLTLLVVGVSAESAVAAPGDLDETFSRDGFVQVDSALMAYSVAPGPGGSTLAVGAV